jgi:outer membrane protein OmpA-like peptidoglycan-associated protein/tetratricopeptide (TPR) repeat protein
MWKLNTLLLTIGLFLRGLHVDAQDPKRDQANLLYRSQAYHAAIESYLKIESSGGGDLETKVRLAECYYFNRDFRNALFWMEKALEINQLSDKHTAIYAELLRTDGRYVEADSIYQYLAIRNQRYKKLASVMSAANIQSIPEARYDVFEINGFNTSGDEMCPIHYKDGLVYVNSSGKKKLYAWNGRPWLNLQYTPSRPKGNNKAKSEPFKGPVNDFLHCGPASFDQQDNLMFFTRNTALRGKNEAGSANMGLYYSYRRSGKWLPAKPFKYNSKNYSIGHPALFNNGREMYFVSDMPGGYGGTDIYYSKYSGNTWTNPVNLGPVVNSEGNELFPFVDKEGNLYFSSDGHTGFGGLDIFQTNLKDGVWTKPSNLGKPVNSGYDDFGITLDKSGKSGYFTSNRPGGQGNDDIYRLALKEGPKQTCIFKLGGMVSDRITLQPVENATISLKLPDGNMVSVTSDASGYYEYNLLCEMTMIRLLAEAAGYFPRELESKREAGSKELLVNIYLDKIELNKSIIVPNIYYDLDKYDIKPEAAKELDKLVDLLKRNPSWIVELASHTDSRADEQYNLRLSRKRAAAAVEYLVSKGIASERLYGKGYGESKLLNECSDGVRCNEEKHAQNRRTEFRLIGYDKFSYQEEDKTVEAERVIFAPEYQEATTGVTYKIQIGVYKNPDKATLNKFSDLGRVVVQNVDDSGLQRYILESYSNYATALGYLKKVQERGIKDAFLLAFRDGNPISMEEARKLEGR